MENEQIKQYIINFVEETLNRCQVFTRTYGKTFAREKLEINLNKVYTDVYNEVESAWYNFESKDMTICSEDKKAKPITIEDIENNLELQQIILHESIHAIFTKTKAECEEIGILRGCGILETYHNGKELGKRFNEGIVEWICEKAGYRTRAYEAEFNCIKLLELALGEDAVMKLAKGDIRGNMAQELQMTEEESVQLLNKIDIIGSLEKVGGNALDRAILDVEDTIFKKYFQKEIDEALQAKNVSLKAMKRLNEMYDRIYGGDTVESYEREEFLTLQFKDYIHQELIVKHRPTFWERLTGGNQLKKTKTASVKRKNTEKTDFRKVIKDMTKYSTGMTNRSINKEECNRNTEKREGHDL